MTSEEASRIIESLRKGIPPDGYVREFTVGRKSEIDQLVQYLDSGQSSALLLKANYGSGKTHLLRFIRELALDDGFAVSMVTVDSQSAVRFNRMDQIMGAVWRGLELPSKPGQKGVGPFFKLIKDSIDGENPFWDDLTNDGLWDYSEELESDALYVALRAWIFGDIDTRNLVRDYLHHPWNYENKRTLLYEEFIKGLRRYFRDPRSDRQFYANHLFLFRKNGYIQSWAVLRDIQRLCIACDLKGLVILFDEFEDVITNLGRIDLQRDAFWNLFQFYGGKKYGGLSFFAVTPDFAQKCKQELLRKDCWDYDYSKFDKLPTFSMNPLEANDLKRLIKHIVNIHALAYDWKPIIKESALNEFIERIEISPIQDKTRQAIKDVVEYLDDASEESA